MSGIKLPLTLSIAGHAVCLALLVAFLSQQVPRISEPVARGGIEVIFQPPAPETRPPAESPSPPEPQAEVVPPPPEPPPVVTEPTPPAPEAPVAAIEPAPPPPPRKPVVKKPPKPVVHSVQSAQPPVPPTPAPTTAAPPQTASAAMPVPAPVPSPEASAGYRALLSAWLESHKRYPDPARQRGEEGNAVLRFEVDRNGRVIDYAVTKSSGYPELDASVEEMMRGATLPPFPAEMPQPRMQVSVTIRFSLRR